MEVCRGTIPGIGEVSLEKVFARGVDGVCTVVVWPVVDRDAVADVEVGRRPLPVGGAPPPVMTVKDIASGLT